MGAWGGGKCMNVRAGYRIIIYWGIIRHHWIVVDGHVTQLLGYSLLSHPWPACVSRPGDLAYCIWTVKGERVVWYLPIWRYLDSRSAAVQPGRSHLCCPSAGCPLGGSTALSWARPAPSCTSPGVKKRAKWYFGTHTHTQTCKLKTNLILHTHIQLNIHIHRCPHTQTHKHANTNKYKTKQKQ